LPNKKYSNVIGLYQDMQKWFGSAASVVPSHYDKAVACDAATGCKVCEAMSKDG
jgi:hypothetical protein